MITIDGHLYAPYLFMYVYACRCVSVYTHTYAYLGVRLMCIVFVCFDSFIEFYCCVILCQRNMAENSKKI